MSATVRDPDNEAAPKSPWLPPRWVVRAAWVLHRLIYRLTGGRRGLWRPKVGRWGALRLTTIGRRTGKDRTAILGYYEDGPNLVTLAMNGWAAPEPAWWLNLQAQPEAIVELKDQRLEVRGRAAVGDERTRLWERWYEMGDDVDGYATRRPSETAVVVLEPRQPFGVSRPASRGGPPRGPR
jgi:F420H(2)-dependent quinone reductase